MVKDFDFIGDVHGSGEKLEGLLNALGYANEDGVYRHRDRQAIFVGDVIDRGPDQLRVLQIVKAMVDVGSAQMVLGNHEFNALAYATFDKSRDDFCRKHTKKNQRQHQAFLEQLTDEEQSIYVTWFYSKVQSCASRIITSRLSRTGVAINATRRDSVGGCGTRRCFMIWPRSQAVTIRRSARIFELSPAI
jgi:hypothetical protein